VGYEPLHHKYRPQTFAQLVGQEAIATTLTTAIRQQKIAPAYLFTGARGTGKTSSARILAKSLNCLESAVPTEKPCGVCESCRMIANGTALDVIEIDAASNTGVDNIRELIERSQFAPVQCRYKVYVIDECLTGDTLVLTQDGLMRIDDPSIVGKHVLSYNDEVDQWESKKALRWFNQGRRQTLVIKTTHREIRCTDNHLIRTEHGWIAAKNIKEGAKILSPENVDVANSFANLEWKDTQLKFAPTQEHQTGKLISTLLWEPQFPGNGCLTSNNMRFHPWNTNLEEVESVHLGRIEPVYDIEVEDNHNFVANGLLVHNCHMLSTAAFNALLKTLEEPPDRVVFVLATTDPQRVLPTIISRCQRFDYRRIPLDAMVAHLQMIAQQEAIAIHSSAVQLVAQISQGGLRDAESLLDQLSLIEGEITTEAVWDLVGAVPEKDLLELVKAIANDNATTVLEQARKLMDRGREPLIVLQNLASFYRDLLIAKTSPQRPDLVAITAPTWAEMCELVKPWSQQLILQGQQKLRESEVQVKQATQPRLWLEVALLQLLPSAIATTTTADQRAAQSIKPSPIIPPPISAPVSPPISPPISPPVSPPISPPVSPPVAQTPKQPQQPPPSVPDLDQETDMPLSELEDIVSSSSTPAIEAITQASEMRSRSEAEGSEAEVSEPELGEPDPIEPELVEPEVSPLDFFAPKPSESPEIIFTNDQPTDTSSGFDLPKIWADVLNLVQPYSTRIMLQQQCQLLRFDGTSAIVGTKTDKLFKMAQERQPNIQKAFDALYGQPIYLKLQVGGSDLPPPPPQSKSPVPRSPQPQPPAPQSATPPSTQPTPPPQSTSSTIEPPIDLSIEPPIDPSMDQFPPAASAGQIDADQQEVSSLGEPKASSKDATSMDQNPSRTAPSAEVDPMLVQWYEPDAVRDAAKNLAQFFNGQIVDLEDEVVPEVGIEELVEEQSELELGEGEPDKDVPF
jgi:DNA polymerase III subunit gamma/tau